MRRKSTFSSVRAGAEMVEGSPVSGVKTKSLFVALFPRKETDVVQTTVELVSCKALTGVAGATTDSTEAVRLPVTRSSSAVELTVAYVWPPVIKYEEMLLGM
jgi:hypothetical protein